MISRSKCVITGCYLFDLNTGAHAYGDLHEIGGCYVLNSCAPRAFGPVGAHERCLTIKHGHDHFERRDVYIVAKDSAYFNQTALDYLK